MMGLSIISLIFSTLIQGIISNYLGYTHSEVTIFSSLYILINLLILRPYFENEKKYIILLIVFGLIVDIAFTNTFIFNTCLFLIIYYFSKFFHSFFPYNAITLSISNLLGVFIYHILTFLILSILKYDSYSVSVLLKILSHSIFMTIIYSCLVHGVVQQIQNKLELRMVK